MGATKPLSTLCSESDELLKKKANTMIGYKKRIVERQC